ncbi:MAG: translocation/assembly module TamB domain-containing protein [Spongiibacteraceae bacterium]
MTTAKNFKSTLLRWLHRSSLVVLALVTFILVAAFATIYFVLNTDSGTQWALKTAQRMVPELSFHQIEGSFLKGINAEQIRWHDTAADVELNNVQLRLRFANLLRGEIHLTTLYADTLNITPLGESNDDPVKLPLLFLPFVLSTSDLAIQQLNIATGDSTFTLHDIRSAISWSATTLAFSETQIRWNDIRTTASGNIGFRGNYPLRLSGDLTLRQWPTAIHLRTRGDLRQLELIANSDKPAKLSATAKLATLDKNLPLKIHAELLDAFTHEIADEKIAIEKATLDADGDLTHMQAQLALTANEPRSGISQVTATARWRDDNTINVDAQWLPTTGRLQMHCDGLLQKTIEAKCNGEATALSLTPWLLEAGLNNPTAELSSAISIDAKWLDPQWFLAVQLPNISGKYNADTLTGSLDLRTDDGALLQLRQMTLAIGPNAIKANGEFGSRNRLRADINATDLAHIDSQLGGNLVGTIALSGETSPTITARLRGSKWQWQDFRADSGNIDIDLAQLGQTKSSGNIELKKLSRADSKPFDLAFNISGEKLNQQWSLHAAQEKNSATLACRTQANADWQQWQYTCNDFSGELREREKQIELAWRNTTTLRGNAVLPTRSFNLEPFCLHGNDIDICLDQTLRITDKKLQTISAHARGVPLQWASAWIPDSVELLGDPRISAQVQLRSLAPLNAQGSADIPATRWRWRTQNATEITAIDAIHIDTKFDEQRAVFATQLHSSSIGDLTAQLTVNEPRGKRTLDGHVNIEQLQLSGFAWAFEGLDAISGEINGAISVTGTFAEPQLHGQILLKDGSALWAPLGSPFRTVHADLTFNNNSAKLGGWFALGQGGGDIDGEISWNDTSSAHYSKKWKLRLGLIAGGVSAMPLPDSTIVFSPHTELIATPGEMHIDGYVDIASADIKLKELPPETTDVSQDQEIVGQQSDEGEWKIWSKIGLNLGDQFHLNGFGADVNLSGKLQLTKAPDDNMHLYGEVKVPRGRYRAYGQKLTVRKGSVIFYGPPDNPDLNLEAVRDLPPGNTDVVGMRVIGSLKTPEAILFSEPSMSDSDIAYYLLTGRKPVANSTGTGGFTASGALLSLGLAGSESKAGQLAEKFGITDLQLGTTEGKNGQSEAEVSGQLGKDLYVRYGRGLGEKSNSISFQYRLTQRLMIETISGVEDALDLLYSFEIK